MINKKAIAAALLLITSLSAKNYFHEEKKQTWFYGVNEAEDEEKKDDQQKPKEQTVKDRRAEEQKFMRSIPFGKLDQLTAKEYREMLDKTKEIATMHPSEENVATYMRLQKFATDQADKFTTMWKKASIQDPSLSYGISTSKVARDQNLKSKTEDIQKFMAENQKFTTFVMFYDESHISDAQAQVNIYRTLESSYGAKIATISIQKNPDYAKTLELQVYPEHWVYYDDGKTSSWQRIGTGIQTLDVLVNNYYFLKNNP